MIKTLPLKYVLTNRNGQRIFTTDSIKRLVSEIGYRFGEQVLLRKTVNGYDVLKDLIGRRFTDFQCVARVERVLVRADLLQASQ